MITNINEWRKVNEKLDNFGHRELEEAIELLTVLKEKGYPENFHVNNIRLEFDENNMDVYLTNQFHQKLELVDGEELLIRTGVDEETGEYLYDKKLN